MGIHQNDFVSDQFIKELLIAKMKWNKSTLENYQN